MFRVEYANMHHDVEMEVAAGAGLRFVRDGAAVGLGSGSTATDVDPQLSLIKGGGGALE